MFTAKAMHGSGAQAVGYRQADNYQQTYRSADRADFANQFSGRLVGILNIGEFSNAKFAAYLDGKFGADEALHVTRGAYKKGQKDDGKTQQTARIGMELNYSGAKSLSVQGLLFDDVVCIEAHREACRVANKYIEDNLLEFRMNIKEIREIQAQGVEIPEFRLVDERLGTCRVKADNWLVTEVLHTVSRFNLQKNAGGDPQVHSHDTAGTHTFTLGKLRSLEFGRVFDNQHLIDAVWKTAQRQYLEEHGRVLTDTKDGFEIAGFRRSDVESFSDGTAHRIPEFITLQNSLRADPSHPQHGQFLDISNAKHREFANAATRGAKADFDFSAHENAGLDEHSDPALSLAAAQAWWTYKAANPAGEKRAAVDVEELRERVEQAQEHGRLHPTAKRTAEQAYGLAIQHLTDRQSSVKNRGVLLQQMLKFGLYQLSPDVLESVISEKIKAGELVLRNDRTALTTKDLILTELRTASLFKQRIGTVKPVTSKLMFQAKLAEYQAEKGFNLSAGQIAAACGVLMSTSAVTIVLGRAGVGKSTILELIKNAQEAEGGRIFGQAPSGKAEEAVLESLAAKPGTYRPASNAYTPHVISAQAGAVNANWWSDNCRPGDIVVLDEAGLVDAKMMSSIMSFAAENQVRLVLSGDPDQFHAVGAGSPFHQICELAKAAPEIGALFEITEMQRARDDETKALHDTVFRDPAAAMVLMHEKGRLALIDDPTEAMSAIATQYSELTESARDNTFVITSRNSTRKELSDAIRTKLGINDKPGIEFDAYERFGGLTGAELRVASSYEPGMTVFFNKTVAPFQKGEACEVLEVTGHTVKLSRKIQDGAGERFETIDFDPMTQSNGISLGEQERIKICEGDRIRFTAESKKLGVKNGDRGVVEELNLETRVAKVRVIGSNKIVRVPLPEHSKGLSIRHNYAATAHSAQGGTAKNCGEVMIYAPTEHGTSYNEMYTNVTRSVQGARSVKLFTDARGADAVNDLMSKAGRKLEHDSALEHSTKEPRILPKFAFTAADGWTNRVEMVPRKEKSLVAQLKEAREAIGQEIGLHGNTIWAKKVLKTIVDNNLDIRITNDRLQGHQDALWASKNADKKVDGHAAKDAGERVLDAKEAVEKVWEPELKSEPEQELEQEPEQESELKPKPAPRPNPYNEDDHELGI